MKKPDRQPRARISRAAKPDGDAPAEKIDLWRDASKEEILARSKKTSERPAPAPRAKKKDFAAGEKNERPEARGKRDFGAGRKDAREGTGGRPDRPRRDDSPQQSERPRRDERPDREERSAFKKPAFQKDDARKPRRDDARGESSGPRKPAKDFGKETREAHGAKKPFARRDDARPPRGEKPFERKPQRDDRGGNERPSRGEKSFGPKARRDDDTRDRKPAARGEKPFAKKPQRDGAREERRPARGEKPFPPKPRRDEDSRPPRDRHDARPPRASAPRKSADEDDEDEAAPATAAGPMTLNKYLAHAGLSSRRDAAAVIKEGKVKVNGEVLLTPGYRVQPGDKVTFEGKAMKPETKKVYVLLNKPKGFITTTDDEQDRRTVMELVQAVDAERLYPVGRLDRNTTGLLLITNDGDLAQRLTHPKYEAKKIYQVGLDKPLTKADFEKLLTTGVELEDGVAKPDKLSFLEDPSELGIEIHSGRNRIVRRMFEALGYDVERLDRVMFAGLTKKNIPRGQWRHLTEQEIVRLKHFKAER